MTKFLIFFALVIVLIFGGLYFVYQTTLPQEQESNTISDAKPVLLNRVTYMCNDAKTIDAAFYERAATPAPAVGQPPVPNGSIKLLLSDGRSFDLPQTISADGARYADESESFVFWATGNGALVLEESEEKSYIGCVLVAPVEIGVPLPSIYANPLGTFSLRLPSVTNATADGYRIDESFKNTLSPSRIIEGVKFTIPTSRAAGTNLSSDTFISVEYIPETPVCEAELFFESVATSSEFIDGQTTYSRATSSEAAAGNRYEETVFALPGTNPCMAVRYMIHYGVFENYATSSQSGGITEFNKEELVAEFDAIRRTLVVNQ